MAQHTKHTSKVRTVTYQMDAAFEAGFCQQMADELLDAAKTKGTVTDYDTGRGHSLWFQGYPGEDLRKLKKRVEELVSHDIYWDPKIRQWREKIP